MEAQNEFDEISHKKTGIHSNDHTGAGGFRPVVCGGIPFGIDTGYGTAYAFGIYDLSRGRSGERGGTGDEGSGSGRF